MSRLALLLVIPLLLIAAGPASARPLELTKLGATAPLGEGGAEIAAFDPRSERAFVTNAAAERLDVYDLSNPSAPVLHESVALPGGPNSVDVSRGIVAVAVEAADKTDPGTVELFDVDGNPLRSIAVGALPDMLTFTKDGETILVANEGEAADDGTADPEGSVSVIDVDRKRMRVRVRTAGFDGVRTKGFVRIACEDATLADDLEPEYIALGRHGTALVTLQEANAVGVLDVDRARFELVRGLGFKDHGKPWNALDPSDEDGGVNIAPWDNLLGMYQPDAIASAGRWFVTANEGDAREREGCEEESRAKDLELDPAAFPNGEGDDEKLGRLNVTTTLGDRDGDGDYDRLFAFGGRSMSILDDDGELVLDTGSQLERIAAFLEPLAFNADNAEPAEVDNRSDNKGPEPEGIAVGELRGDDYAFVGSERQGGIYAFELDGGDRPRFAGYVNTRPGDLGPEGLLFVDRDDSPTRRALLLVTHEISGTLAVISMR
jgi:choice-of-anchor I-like protein